MMYSLSERRYLDFQSIYLPSIQQGLFSYSKVNFQSFLKIMNTSVANLSVIFDR